MITATKQMLRSSLLGALLALSQLCLAGGGHDHGAGAHDDHGGDHDDGPALVYTHYTEMTELFVEFPPLVINEPSTFVAHFTRMDNFQPLTRGVLDVHLKQNNKTAARFRVKAPARKGIFLPAVTAKKAGDYQLLLEIRDGDLHAIHDLGKVTVFPDRASATVEQGEHEGEISYLKEQQWQNPFGIARSQERRLRASVPGFGTVMAPADGSAIVRAPSDGYFSTPSLVNAGERVARDQLLGNLMPRLGEGADIGDLLVARERARAKHQLTQADVKRLKGLFNQGAIPEKRLQEAERALEVAKVELKTAQSRIQQRTGKQGAAGIALRTPIVGEVVDVSVRPGAFVRSGDELFTIAQQDKRWLNIQVPEKFGSQLRNASGAWLSQDGVTFVLDQSNGARVIKVAQQVDPLTRTVSVGIEYPSALGPNLLGARLPVSVYLKDPDPVLSVPVSAVIDDGGQPVVYVQTGGESFSRKTITLGLRDGDWVEVLSGLQPDEWVVSEGAYYVKLASTGGDAIGHGHAH